MRAAQRLILWLCCAETLSMSGVMFFPAQLPFFQALWSLSNTAAGWVNGAFYGGYALAVPLLVALTDRRDARRIYIGSALLGAAALAGFALLATGAWSAGLCRMLAGVALAGTYMPGLKALSDRLSGALQARAVAVYTACFAIGTALSMFLAGQLLPLLDWRSAAGLLALGPLAAALLSGWALVPRPVTTAAQTVALWDFRPVVRNRPAFGYTLGYAAHCWELFGYRGWLVAFLTCSLSLAGSQHAASGWASPQNLATLALLIGSPASIAGNEWALRLGRQRALTLFMGLSGLCGCVLGFCVGLPYALVALLCVLYGALVMTDSGTLTAGVVACAEAHVRGQTMALYSFLGFVSAFLAPLAVGVVLDGFGQTPFGWGLAFAVLGLGALSGPLWLRRYVAVRA